MKKTILILLIVVSPFVAKSTDTTKVFSRNAIYSVSGAFTELDNWNAGGENRIRVFSEIFFVVKLRWIDINAD